MNKKRFEQAKSYALRRLERELPAHLYYHSFMHTRDEVVPAAERMAEMEGVKGIPLQLLLTATWFHDLGYAEQLIYHELIAARIAEQVLPDFGYTNKEIEVIRWAIYATILPQKPHTLLEQIIADADLDVLGSENFAIRNNELRQEFAAMGKEYADIDWWTSQIKFLESHQYFTKSARVLRGPGKLSNIIYAKGQLEELEK